MFKGTHFFVQTETFHPFLRYNKKQRVTFTWCFTNNLKMKRLLLVAALMLVSVVTVRAQRLVIGEKAPEIRVAAWQDGRTPVSGAMLVDFFASSNPQCVANLDKLNTIQGRYGDRLQVVVISREGAERMAEFTAGKNYRFRIGEDDGGKTFAAFNVRFVPFAALIDARGRLVWTGNVTGLTDETIERGL